MCKDVYKNVQVKTKQLTILQKCSLKIKKNSIVAIMGPSGCGKSTLLNLMNGLNPASGGNIYINGQNLYKNYDSLKKSFGYVPQDDIVHANLTVYETLWYAAKLRLEDDITDEEIKKRIDKILKELNIFHEKAKMVSELSGGGRKRVCIASELLTEPSILFLDEPTSPLDPAMINEFLTILKNLSKQGTTIIMVTHKPEDLQYMDEVIFLASRGFLSYHGKTGPSMYNHFGKSDIIGIYELLNDSEQIKEYYKETSSSRAGMTSIIEMNMVVPALSKENNSLLQIYWLSRRYLALKLSDKRATAIAILQAPFIAIIMLLIFDHVQVRMLYFLAISAIWCGVNNSAREISSEVNIYKRERMFNLRIFSYLSSKIIVQSILIFLQTLFFLIVLQLFYGLADSFAQFIQYGLFLFFLTLSATFMGLFISAVFQKQEKVTSMMPVVLLPQILLAGVISPLGLNGAWHVDALSQLTLGRWGTQGLCNIEKEVTENINYIFGSNSLLDPMPERKEVREETIHFTEILTYPDRFKIGKKYTNKYTGESFRQYALIHDYLALLILNGLFITGIVWGLQKMDPL
ncbi:MAG: ATP-binding cassette domain-containing protein [Chitinophagales bacterium]